MSEQKPSGEITRAVKNGVHGEDSPKQPTNAPSQRKAITKMPKRLRHDKPNTRRKAILLDPNAEETWLKLPMESGKAYQAFGVYRDMDPGERSLAKTSKQLGKSRQLIENWSRTWAWVQRVAAWDSHRERLRIQAELETEAREAAKSRKQRIVYARSLQAKGAEGLLHLDTTKMNAHQAARLLHVGMHNERVERGVPTKVTEARVAGSIDVAHRAGGFTRGKIDLDRLTPRELEQLQRLVEKATVPDDELDRKVIDVAATEVKA